MDSVEFTVAAVAVTDAALSVVGSPEKTRATAGDFSTANKIRN